jgi:hypothetical protein
MKSDAPVDVTLDFSPVPQNDITVHPNPKWANVGLRPLMRVFKSSTPEEFEVVAPIKSESNIDLAAWYQNGQPMVQGDGKLTGSNGSYSYGPLRFQTNPVAAATNGPKTPSPATPVPKYERSRADPTTVASTTATPLVRR